MNFWQKYKKIILVVIFLIVILGMGYLIWQMFFAQVAPTPTTPPSEEEPISGGFPQADEGEGGQVIDEGEGRIPEGEEPGEGEETPKETPSEPLRDSSLDPYAIGGSTQINRLTEERSLNPTLSQDGNSVQYYNQDDGKFYKIDAEGNKVALSDKVFHNVDKVNWAPNKSKAVIEYPDGSNILYNFDKEEQHTIPKHWEDFSFSPDSNKLVSKSIGQDPENRWLITSNDDGSQTEIVEFIGENADKVISSWSPNNQVVAMHTEGKDFNRQELFFVGKNNENFKSTIVEGRDVRPQWSPEGDTLLYSAYNSNSDMKPKLWLVGAEGENIGKNRRSVGLETWGDKCTFANNSEVYCAVPESLERGAGIFPESANNTKDELYKVNTKTGTKKKIAVPEGDFNISEIVVNEDTSKLFFTDNNTKQIYKIDLK